MNTPSTLETIQLYKSKPLSEMTHEELDLLYRGLLEWTFLKEYTDDSEKMQKLTRILAKIRAFLTDDPDQIAVANSMF